MTKIKSIGLICYFSILLTFGCTTFNISATDNKTIIKPDEPKDSQDEPPGQNKEESNGLPDTLFQG